MTGLARLLALVPPPAAPVDTDADWTRVEDALGLILPREFTEIARRYGRGAFCDEFSCRTPEQMIRQSRGRLEGPRPIPGEGGEGFPHPGYSEPGGLVPWGSDSVGGTLCWVTEPAGSPERWTTVYRMSDDEFVYPEGGAAAVLTGLLQNLTARMREDGSDVDGPWFSPYRAEVHVYLRLTEADGAPPYEERLRILRQCLAPTSARGGFTGAAGDRQDHFAAAGDEWALTYETAYGHRIRVAYPPMADTRVRRALLAAIDAMGCRVTAVLPVHGPARWPELE